MNTTKVRTSNSKKYQDQDWETSKNELEKVKCNKNLGVVGLLSIIQRLNSSATHKI